MVANEPAKIGLARKGQNRVKSGVSRSCLLFKHDIILF